MEFSALAAKETSALLTRVLGTASKASLERVDALRAALDTASKALEGAITAAPDVERDVDELVKRLTKRPPPKLTRGSSTCRPRPARSRTPCVRSSAR